MNLLTYAKNTRQATSEWSFSDNVLPNAGIFEMDVRNGGSVVSSPVEEGSFTSYNKTTEPLEIMAVLSFNGSDSYLQSVLDNLRTLKESVTTFSIETPAYEYQNMTLQNFDHSWRREQGRGVLYVHCVFIEIREVQVAYTETAITQANTKDASATSTVNGGLKQAQTPNTAQETAGQKSRQSILRSLGVGG